jgi:hypothetical protein
MKGGREIPPPSMKERARLERESEWQEDFEAAERERERIHQLQQLQLYRERIARQNEEIVNRRISEHRARMNSSACSILGGRVKNILQKKNKSNKNKSKRVNKRVKNKRYSRKSLKKCLH